MRVCILKGDGIDSEPIGAALRTIFGTPGVEDLSIPALLGDGLKNCHLLVVPGGRGSKYLAKNLGERGAEAIQRAVAHGMNYFGVCAGAAYAASGLRWHGISLEESQHCLGLLPVTAVGPLPGIWPGQKFIVSQEMLVDTQKMTHRALNLAGSSFEVQDGSQAKVLYRYHRGGAPAVVSAQFGKGTVVGSGPHGEYTLSYLLNQKSYFSNVKTLETSERQPGDENYSLLRREVPVFLSGLSPESDGFSHDFFSSILREAFGYQPTRRVSALSEVAAGPLSRKVGMAPSDVIIAAAAEAARNVRLPRPPSVGGRLG